MLLQSVNNPDAWDKTAAEKGFILIVKHIIHSANLHISSVTKSLHVTATEVKSCFVGRKFQIVYFVFLINKILLKHPAQIEISREIIVQKRTHSNHRGRIIF